MRNRTKRALDSRLLEIKNLFNCLYQEKNFTLMQFSIEQNATLYYSLMQSLTKRLPIMIYRNDFNSKMGFTFVGDEYLIKPLISILESLVKCIEFEVYHTKKPKETTRHLSKIKSTYRYNCISYINMGVRNMKPVEVLFLKRGNIKLYCQEIHQLKHLKYFYGK